MLEPGISSVFMQGRGWQPWNWEREDAPAASAAPQAPCWHLPPGLHRRGNIALLAGIARLSKSNMSLSAARRWGGAGGSPGAGLQSWQQGGRAAGPVPAWCQPAAVPSGSAGATDSSGRLFAPVHCQVSLGFSPLGTRLQFFGSAGEEARRALVVFIRV